MQAIILAAGMGKRLKSLTANNTKCMVNVNGMTLIERTLRVLDKKGLSHIIIVIGYQGKNLKTYIGTLDIHTPIIYIDNPIYDKTNNIYSLALAKDYLMSEDTLLFESDLIFEESLVDDLLNDERDTLAIVDKFESWMDGTCMVLDKNDCIIDFVPGKYLKFTDRANYYKTVNIYKFSQHFSKYTYIPFLEAYSKAMGNNEYYESVIKLIAMLETKEIRAKRLDGQCWYEIDDIQDLDIAESLFARNPEEKYDAINSRYGGYWRYPKLIDFCYLVNPYFPSPKMVDEIQSNFISLMSQYPSGMRVNTLLAAKNFGLDQEHVVVGNGAAELIKCLMDTLEVENIGFIKPTFEEYPNRFFKKAIVFDTSIKDFQYDAEDIIHYFSDKAINALVLINPDNPSGNYLSLEQLRQLISWSKKNHIVLIIDESFVDFAKIEGNASWEDNTLLKEEIISSYKNLFVIKSISKSYGVPGFRLGILASSNVEFITKIKKCVAIWNINSYGEFFMQIFEKYKKDYNAALNAIMDSREHLIKDLRNNPNLKVFPSQANYIMCEITNHSWTSRQLTTRLLEENIYIKDLTKKIGNGKQYIRLAVRNEKDNSYLVRMLEQILS